MCCLELVWNVFIIHSLGTESIQLVALNNRKHFRLTNSISIVFNVVWKYCLHIYVHVCAFLFVCIRMCVLRLCAHTSVSFSTHLLYLFMRALCQIEDHKLLVNAVNFNAQTCVLQYAQHTMKCPAISSTHTLCFLQFNLCCFFLIN